MATLYTSHCNVTPRAEVNVFAQAAADLADAKARAAALPTGHGFVRPGQVAPDMPAPDACMTCGQPAAAHGSQS